jgi:hypothetical protein
MTPVIVHPSAEQISSATEILTVSEGDNYDNCSICVEAINSGTEVRRINHCRHTFHRACIDTWFARNVRCPNCRFDIRDTTHDEEPTANTYTDDYDSDIYTNDEQDY